MESAEFPAVFIIGSHRSGTSILCRLLAASGSFSLVTAFHVLNRERLLDLHRSGTLEIARAKMASDFRSASLQDEYGNPITPDTLEEYAFALTLRGRHPVLNERNLPEFLAFCRSLRSIQGSAKPLLLKSPFDTARFLFIRAAFPHARFVFIHRHPAQIISSQMRLLRQIVDRRLDYDAMMHAWYRNVYDSPVARTTARFLFSPRLPILLRWIESSVSRNCDYIVENFDRLGGLAKGVTYSQVCQSPSQTVAELLDFAGVKAELAPDYDQMLSPGAGTLIPEVERRVKVIESRNAAYCRKFEVGAY